MLTNQRSFIMTTTFKTRITKTSTPVETVATINWEGVTDEQLKELAERAVVIATQAAYRTAEHVPATDTIEVVKMLVRAPRAARVLTTTDVVASVGNMTPEQRALILKMLGQ
jgi:hypothetical protein